MVVLTCLGHFWWKMVANKENITVQYLHVCPAELCILKLQTAWVLTALIKLASTLSQRGNVRMIHTDNGTNFLGTSIELRKAFTVMNYTKINNFLMELGGEWITWRQILPMTSNMVGVWKHQICSAQNILNSLNNEFSIFRAEQMWRKLRTYGERLNTAKPVYSDHSEDDVSVVFIGRWSL